MLFRCVILIFLYSGTIFSQDSLETLLSRLEDEMSRKEYYDNKKENRIQNILEKIQYQSDIFKIYELNTKIFEEYEFYSFDKALEYVEKNIEIAEKLDNTLLLNRAKLKLALLLVNSGRYKESIDALNDIKKASLPDTLINNYYLAYEEGYSGLSFNTTVNSSKSKYNELYFAYQDSLNALLKPNSEEALRIKEKDYRDSRNLEMALEINSERLSRVELGERLYALITFERSLLYELKNDLFNQKKYLIQSAISDIIASVKDNASMGTLAKILFEEGDIDQANRYINFSYDDAEFYNSRLRFVNIANNMPLITKAYEKKTTKQKMNLQRLLVFISFLTIFLIIAVYYVFNRNKKLSEARNSLKLTNIKLTEFNHKLNASNDELKYLYQKLSESNEIKEHYIGTFVNLYSEYISKLDTYRTQVTKYVQTNQIKSLLKLSKSKQLLNEEIEIFNKNFDSSFLQIHPDFVVEVNKLLKPDHEIVLEDENTLNTSLRILALIKLDITSSSRIAKILMYSVNTIYNYRASLNKAAIDKDNFEEKIKSLK
jgi:hypothetical protein